MRDDQITAEESESLPPDRIVICPGPGTPADAGIFLQVIRRVGGRRDILGVWLGHQCIGAVFGLGSFARRGPTWAFRSDWECIVT